MGFFDVLNKDVETKDLHANNTLRTHYYRAEYPKAKDTILRYLSQNNYKVKNVDDTYGEILVETSKFYMVISIRKMTVIQVSIDVKVTVFSLIGGYKPIKHVKELYDYCDKQLTFVGVGLQP
ncbi:MAG: hypothetical protein K0Q49_1441 [Haloplasmataceae bacterium]|jgi:hypothetical protein|nr:hypothetical protein [Haloplasmataceae bacterium]